MNIDNANTFAPSCVSNNALIGKEKRSFSFAYIQREHVFFWFKTMRF